MIGEKSNPPQTGNLFLIGRITGSVTDTIRNARDDGRREIQLKMTRTMIAPIMRVIAMSSILASANMAIAVTLVSTPAAITYRYRSQNVTKKASTKGERKSEF